MAATYLGKVGIDKDGDGSDCDKSWNGDALDNALRSVRGVRKKCYGFVDLMI